MTTEHEARDFFADHGFLDRDNAREVLRCLDVARLVLAERDAEIAQLLPEYNAALKGELLLRQDVLSSLATAQARGDNLAKELSERNAHMDELHDALMERDAKMTAIISTQRAEISRLKKLATELPVPGYLSGELNPFPERPGALEIAEKLIRAYLLDIGAGMDDFTQHEVEFSEKIAAAIGAAAHASSGASALAIAERFRLFFQRPYPMSEEGVERAVQALAQEIEAAIRHNEARPGTSALEATRDLFQSLEGWRPTDDWSGVPGRLKLMFDRALHAILAAEARGRTQRKNPVCKRRPAEASS